MAQSEKLRALGLLWNGEPLGMVTVATRWQKDLSRGPGDASLVQELAEHAAAAVAHARTYTRVQAQRAETEEANHQPGEQTQQF
ncbi:MAG: hypothetical protein LC797_04225 [Chloroflexi bacterium]|nr:hypothetical protein [Chloroflexota bacterium]